MSWAVTAMTAVGAYSANEQYNLQRKQAEASAENSARRYKLEAEVARQQMQEQGQELFSGLSETSLAYLKARGTMEAISAEAGVAGNSKKRLEHQNRLLEMKSKNKLRAKKDENIINIANGMLASKVNTEAEIEQAKNSVGNWYSQMAIGMIQGGIQGYQLQSSINANQKASDKLNQQQNMKPVTTTPTGYNAPAMAEIGILPS